MKPEFSKIILGAVMLTYEAAAVFGAVIVSEEHALLPELLTFIGAPTAAAIGFYAWKAKAENLLKIAKSKKRLTKQEAAVIKKLWESINGTEEENADE